MLRLIFESSRALDAFGASCQGSTQKLDLVNLVCRVFGACSKSFNDGRDDIVQSDDVRLRNLDAMSANEQHDIHVEVYLSRWWFQMLLDIAVVHDGVVVVEVGDEVSEVDTFG